MNLKRQGFLQRSIKRKDCGQIEWVSGLFWVLMLGVVMYTRLQLAAWQSVSVYLEDTLAASNLASALIDLEEYGKTHKILIEDVQGAYEIYLEAVQNNLQLDADWMCGNDKLIAGPVEIADYIIYNVDDDTVEMLRVGNEGQIIERRMGDKGSMQAPNGIVVENTGVYSEITFAVQGFPGINVQAKKGKLVDIVSERGEKDENR